MSNQIHPTAIIGDRVQLGDDNVIGPYCVLEGPLKIGNGNRISPHVVIGTPGQDTRNPHYDSSNSPIEIGNDNIIREFTAIQKPCYRDITRLGNNVFLMHGVHIPHDAILEDGVVVTPHVVIGGIARIMKSANLGMGCTVHQYSVIGPYSIVATGAAAVKNLRPFARFVPGKPISVNDYAVTKYGFEAVAEEIRAYVMEGQAPTSDSLLAVTEPYERLHAESHRPQY